MEKKTESRGGRRVGAGRKKLNKIMLHTSIDIDFYNKLKECASKENLTIGSWLVKHVHVL